MKKKILALVLALTLALCAIPSAYAYSVREAYMDFAAQYPGFINDVVDQGVSESVILEFLRDVQNYLYQVNRIEKINDGNFDDILIEAIKTVSNSSKFADLQNALYNAYPDAAYEAVIHGRIHEDFIPIYNSIKSMIFEHDMLAEMDTGKDDPVDVAITEIGEPKDVEVERGGSYTLDGSVSAETETGVSIKLEVEWTNEPSTSKVGVFTAEGQVKIPSGYVLADGLDANVSAMVTVVESENNDNDDKKPNTGNENTGTSGNDVQTPGENETVKHIYSFSDVDEKTELGKAVYALSDIGIINGYVDGTFKAENKIRRDEFAKIMVTAMDNLDINAVASFTDVPNTPDNWAYIFIASAEKAGLINGKGDGTFGPGLNIRRDEVMAIIYRAIEGKKAFAQNEVLVPKFSDDAAVADWARMPVYMLAQNGIVSGVKTVVNGAEINNIDPLSDATRGQCVIMVYNALKMMGKIK